MTGVRGLTLTSLGAVVLLTGAAQHVRADHGRDAPNTSDSAYTLPRGMSRIGLWRQDYGATDTVTVGTHTALWFLYAANLHAKWKFWHNPRWATAARLGFVRLDLSRLGPESGGGDAIFSVVPFELGFARAWGDSYVWNLQFVYTHVGVKGSTGDDALQGAVGVSNAQWVNTFQWNASRTFALVAQLRTLIFQTAQGNVEYSWQLDDFTTAELHAEGESSILDLERGSSIILSALWSWERFNLRVGASFGNYSIPVVNFVIPDRRVIPEVDVYWRF